MGCCFSHNEHPPENSSVPPIDISKLNENFNNYLNADQIQDFLDKKYNKEDYVFNSIRKEEKDCLINFYKSNKNFFVKDIGEYLGKQNTNFITNLTHQIIENENGREIFEKKIQQEIQSIYNDEKINEINYLTIMIIGVTGTGKSTLINTLLKKNLAKTGVGNIVTTKTRIYSNDKVPYIHLVDTRGIELGTAFNADTIAIQTQTFIKELYNTQKISNFVHCIWYCIRADRFQSDELQLVRDLQYTIKENKIPIILVRTVAADEEQDKLMEDDIKNKGFGKNFIKVLAKKYAGKEPYGLDELLRFTLKRVKQAANGDMKEMMIQNISNEIKSKLFENTKDTKELILKKMMLDVIRNDKAGEDFKRYIVDIYSYNVCYFLNKTRMSNKSISLIENSEFNAHKNNFQLFCSNKENEMIKNSLQGFANKFLDIQAKKQKIMRKVIELENIRDFDDFVCTTEKFLTNNYNYLSQKHYISFVIKKMSLYLSQSFEEILNSITTGLMNRKEIRNQILNCFEKKFDDFEKRIEKYKIHNINNIDDIHYEYNQTLDFEKSKFSQEPTDYLKGSLSISNYSISNIDKNSFH